MILAAHHPCYLPPVFFFQKLICAEVFVIADDFQFSKHALINRARIKTAPGPNWLTVPVRTRARDSQTTRQVAIENSSNWREKHWRSLEVSYIYAAYFEMYAEELAGFYQREWFSLLDLNLALIDFLNSAFGINRKLHFSSDLKLKSTGADKLCEMLSALNCTTYLVEDELKNHLSSALFSENGFELRFFTPGASEYHQLHGDFTHGLSAIDLLLNEGPESRAFIPTQIG